jgi:Acetyltransferase (GNAT) domain
MTGEAQAPPGEGSIRIRPYEPGDEHAILRAFHKVFPWAKRSLDEWNWEYKNSPLGVHCFLGVTPGGDVVSQFAGIPRRVQVGREERVFAEMVDSLVDPEQRQGLKKPGLFARTVNAYVAHFGRPDRETLMYGLPNPPAYRIGNRFLNYNDFYLVDALERPVGDASALPPAPDLGGGSFEEVAELPSDTDALWARVRGDFDVATVRDRRYLTWRYVAKPNAPYRRLVLRDAAGALAGIVVLRDDWLRQETGRRTTVVAEWVVDRRHPLAPALPAAIARLAHAAGAERVQFVFRPQSDEWKHLVEVGYDPAPTGFRLVGGTYDHAVVPLSRLVQNWFITLGDFDVV